MECVLERVELLSHVKETSIDWEKAYEEGNSIVFLIFER